MFLSKNQNGFYYVYYEVNGKRASKSTKCKHKKDAIKFLTGFNKELEEKKNQKVIPITLKELQFHFFRYAESIFTYKTIQGYKVTFNFLIKHFGNIQLSELNKTNLENYIYGRVRTRSLFAGKKDYAHLSSVFNKAIQDGYLVESPLKGIKRIKTPQKLPLFYSKDDFRLLVSSIDNEDIRDLVIVAVNTGLRQMELLTLQWNQINFEDRILILDNQGHITKGKKVRTIPLNKNSYEVLQKRYNSKLDHINNVFTYNGLPVKQDFIIPKFKKYIRKIKVNQKLNFHSLRHTCASWLVQSGVSIYTVSKLLGHADIATTQIYSHLRREDLKDASDKIDY